MALSQKFDINEIPTKSEFFVNLRRSFIVFSSYLSLNSLVKKNKSTSWPSFLRHADIVLSPNDWTSGYIDKRLTFIESNIAS